MLWLIQKMKNESAFDEIIRLLNKYEIDYQIVKALSFSNKIVNPDTVLSGQDISEIPELKINSKQKIFTIGSYTLAKIAKEKNWTPGSFINDNFDLKSWKNGWGENNLLNGNALIDTVENISSIDMPKFFARPLHDTKSFSGTVFDKEEFLYWREQLLNTNSQELNKDTEIVISPLKDIYYEVRCFVIDKKIVTQSIYKRGNYVVYDPLVSQDILDWTQSMIDKWVPDRAFVMDVAQTPDGFKIIEVNNISSSGFYACDLNKIIIGIESMVF